jgi:hypothetical protein
VLEPPQPALRPTPPTAKIETPKIIRTDEVID